MYNLSEEQRATLLYIFDHLIVTGPDQAALLSNAAIVVRGLEKNGVKNHDINSFVAYVKQFWKNKPDASTPLSAERLTHMEEGIKGNSNAIETIAAAVVNQIVNDPDKIASMAALYSVNQKIGDVSKLPDSAVDVVTAIAKQIVI